jgi:hypothetical protein
MVALLGVLGIIRPTDDDFVDCLPLVVVVVVVRRKLDGVEILLGVLTLLASLFEFIVDDDSMEYSEPKMK